MNLTSIRAEHFPVFQEIAAEMDRARALRDAGKFVSTAEDMVAHLEDGERDAYDVLMEEVGEIATDRIEGALVAKRREEWLQVAAVATAALMGFDRRYPDLKSDG